MQRDGNASEGIREPVGPTGNMGDAAANAFKDCPPGEGDDELMCHLVEELTDDFNNILASVITAATLIRMRVEADEDVGDVLDDLDQAVDRGRRLTRLLKEMTTREEPDCSTVDLAEIVSSWTRRAAAERGLDVRLVAEETTRPVRCDPILMQRALDVLMMTSGRARRGPDEVTIALSNTSVDAMDGPPTDRCFVRTAVSMSRKEVRTDSTQPLGSAEHVLVHATVRSIMMRHGGTLEVGGSPEARTYELLLPACSSD